MQKYKVAMELLPIVELRENNMSTMQQYKVTPYESGLIINTVMTF